MCNPTNQDPYVSPPSSKRSQCWGFTSGGGQKKSLGARWDGPLGKPLHQWRRRFGERGGGRGLRPTKSLRRVFLFCFRKRRERRSFLGHRTLLTPKKGSERREGEGDEERRNSSRRRHALIITTAQIPAPSQSPPLKPRCWTDSSTPQTGSALALRTAPWRPRRRRPS